jgi:nuclear transport factor 2 (NTF2) superfamily protein
MHESEYYDTFDQLRRKYNINSEYDIIFEENSSTGEYLLMNWGYDGDNDNGYFSTYPDASWTNGSREYKYDKKIHYDFR